MKERIEYSLLIVGVCMIIVALIIPIVKKIANHIGAMDIPDARKVHTKPIPRYIYGIYAWIYDIWSKLYSNEFYSYG